MRLIAIAALAGVLVACGEAETEVEPAVEEEAAAPAQPLGIDGAPTPGMYRVTDPDGTVLMVDVREDGTYTTTVEGQGSETGRWRQPDPSTYCYTPDVEGAEEVCLDEEIGEDGVWRSTDPDGKTQIVERVEG